MRVRAEENGEKVHACPDGRKSQFCENPGERGATFTLDVELLCWAANERTMNYLDDSVSDMPGTVLKVGHRTRFEFSCRGVAIKKRS